MPQEKKNPYAEHATVFDEFAVRLCLPEHYLMWAVLQRALIDRVGACWVSKVDQRSARRFFDDEPEEREGLFSFHSIAEHLDPHGDSAAFKAGILQFLAEALGAKEAGRKGRGGGRTVKPQ